MRRVPAILLAAASLAAMGLVPTSAGATTWASQAEACGGYNTSERGSGQMDAYGRLYVPCSLNEAGQHDNYVSILDTSGNRIKKVPLDFTPDDGRTSTDRAGDVAPSPDGSYLYVIKYADYTAYRFDRQGDGSYRRNATWKLANYPYAGGGAAVNRPLGQFLAADGNGDIYFSSGLWAENVGGTDDAIVKYRPDGSYVTRFGTRSGTWALGTSRGSFGGLAVTADGRRVFVTDINNSRVQRFDRAGDGSYGAVLAMGMDQYTDPNVWGACNFDQPGALPQALAAPYDLAMSARGELLVVNTTCYATKGFHDYVPAGTIEVRRFGQDGSVRGTIVSRSLADDRVHGIAVDHAGNIHLAQAKAMLRPAAGWSDAGADAGGGGPMGGVAAVDTTAPTITAFGAPATTQSLAITLSIAATDASGVTAMRIREDGAQGGWVPYAGTLQHTLAARDGAHVLELEVRDSVGNVSAAARATVTKTTPPAPVQPTQPAQPKPTQPTKPAKPTAPAGDGDVPTVVAGGGAGTAAPKPRIASAKMPPQVYRGRRLSVTVRATGEHPVTLVRFATTGRWSKWQRVRGRHVVLLPAGVGWKGVLVQVRDSVGTRSTPWFQPVLLGPKGTQWVKGTKGRNVIRTGRGNQNIDLSSFDSTVDRVSCGAGHDTVYAQPEDVVARDCERVIRVKLPRF